MDAQKNIIGIIPCRMASTRFPGKPLERILGIPMIGHVFYRAKMSKIFERLVIATCDEEIKRYADSIGAEAIMTSAHHERASDRAAEAMLRVETSQGRKSTIAVMIQGDEPMITPAMIESAVKPLLENADVLVSNLMSGLKSVDEENDPNEVKVVVDSRFDALYFSREPIPSRKKSNGNFHAWKQICIIPFRRDFLLTFNSLQQTPLEKIESVDMLRVLEHGYKVRMVPTQLETYSVDTPEDLKFVESKLINDSLIKQYA